MGLRQSLPWFPWGLRPRGPDFGASACAQGLRRRSRLGPGMSSKSGSSRNGSFRDLSGFQRWRDSVQRLWTGGGRGFTESEVAQKLTTCLSAILKNPQVSLFVKEYNSKKSSCWGRFKTRDVHLRRQHDGGASHHAGRRIHLPGRS